MPSLFDPIEVGAVKAPNRIFMAPMTRARSSRRHVPRAMMADYYAQRASAGLIISEATGISQQGLGWPYAPGIWSDEQVEAWRPVVQAVKAAGGRFFMQLWHMGRIVHPDFLGGMPPVSASRTTAPHYAHTYAGKKQYEEARALELDEIPGIVSDYRRAAGNAIAVGCDGVQLHAANGYLIDQFLRNKSNLRTDVYGGVPQNRVRLLREVTEAIAGEIGADRTAVRLSPNGESNGVTDSDPMAVFKLAAELLDEIGIAFLELREMGPQGTFGKSDQAKLSPMIRQSFHGSLVLNQDYDRAHAQAALDDGHADAISFGRPFIANPNLPEKLATGRALASDDMASWYTQSAEGYLDYALS